MSVNIYMRNDPCIFMLLFNLHILFCFKGFTGSYHYIRANAQFFTNTKTGTVRDYSINKF